MIEYSNPIIVIAGPTASGKSDIAIKLAKDIDGVIINADSKQIYKEISIGTAKPSEKEMDNIPHYLFGHVSLKEEYSIYKYQKDVAEILRNLPKGKTPILVGGTGLYIDSIIYNYKLDSNNNVSDIRKDLNNKSISQLQSMIDKNLLSSLNSSDLNNPRRLIRIIEKGKNGYERGHILKHLYIVIDIPRDLLKERIEKRTNIMFKNGLLEENEKVRELGLDKYQSIKTIGYQEFNEYFSKKISLDEVKIRIINHTNQYAKRQITWFRRNKQSIWTNNYNQILEESLKLINS